MQIGHAVYEALQKNDANFFCVVADWIEDNRSDHPEAEIYMERLRLPNIRIRTVIDVVCKFGSRGERKLFSRINRIIMELRHRPELAETVGYLTDLFSMEGRRRVNKFKRVSPVNRSRKKPVLALTRKRQALNNDFWYMKALKSLLAKHY